MLKICSPSWPPETKMRPSNIVTPAALRLALISVTTVHLSGGAPTNRATLPLGPAFVKQEDSPVGLRRVTLHGVERRFSVIAAAHVDVSVHHNCSHRAADDKITVSSALRCSAEHFHDECRPVQQLHRVTQRLQYCITTQLVLHVFKEIFCPSQLCLQNQGV